LNNAELHNSLINLFSYVIANRQVVTDVAHELDIDIKMKVNELEFTLPDLYRLCCRLDDVFISLEYRVFRRLLYDNPTNQEMAKQGGKFELAEDRGHVDKNLYRLKTSKY
jgi:hypothetical protein